MAIKLTPKLVKELTNKPKAEPFCPFPCGGYCDLKRCEGKCCESHPLNIQSVAEDIRHGRKIENFRKSMTPQAKELLEEERKIQEEYDKIWGFDKVVYEDRAVL